MTDIYYQKYLKYKNKYLSLKADIDDQYAGANIVVLYKVKAKVTKASEKGKDRKEYSGDKIIEFGTVKDNRSHVVKRGVAKTSKETNPYIRIGKKIHQINEAFGQKETAKILAAINAKEVKSLVGKPFSFLDKPCHDASAAVSQALAGSQMCNKNRGKVDLTIASAELLKESPKSGKKMRGGAECQESDDCDWPKDRCVWPGKCV